MKKIILLLTIIFLYSSITYSQTATAQTIGDSSARSPCEIATSNISLRNVTLKIYNVLGNKISRLVNELKPSCQIEVKFNEINYSSGVYYYQLIVRDFI